MVRGTAQNPDVYFQARETVNPYYAAVPGRAASAMESLAARTGRRYSLVSYHGHPQAERVIVIMGSGAETAAATAAYLAARGERVGVVQVRLFRPFPAAELLAALPSSVERVAVLDRTKEPGSLGEPLFLDVLAALAEATSALLPPPPSSAGRRAADAAGDRRAVRAGVEGVHAGDGRGRLRRARARRRRGLGSPSGSTTMSRFEPAVRRPGHRGPGDDARAVFFGLGSDGTVSANKNSIKILGDAGLHAQGYFVYDSKKSGSETVSPPAVRAGPDQRAVPDRAGRVRRRAPGAADRPGRGA